MSAVKYEPHTRTKSNIYYGLLLSFWFHYDNSFEREWKAIALRIAFIYRQIIYTLNVTVIKVLLNGEVQQVASSCTLAEVFQQLCIDLATHCAVSVNAKVISRDKFAHTLLHEGDVLLVIHLTWISIVMPFQTRFRVINGGKIVR